MFSPKEHKGIRMLYHANAPWARTGYGVQSNSLLPRLLQLPSMEDVAIFAYYGIQGGTTRQRIGHETPMYEKGVEVMCYPPRSDPWGNDVVHEHIDDFDADMVITLFDLWPLANDFGWRGARWCPWFPVDHEPIPPQVLERTKASYTNLVYSKSAAAELRKNGVDHVYIPHGVETTVYRPLPAEERAAAKKWLGFPEDCFLVGTVGANKGWPPRKGWNEMYTALAEFKERAPNNKAVYFYQHSLVTTEHGGADLSAMMADFGMSDWARYPDPYMVAGSGFTSEQMNKVYNAMDAFILLSRGEGFGVPIVEAQACGVPVIVTDWTACRELGEVGYRVPIMEREWTLQRSWWGIADPHQAAEALLDVHGRWLAEWAHDDAPVHTELRDRARAFALQYDWQTLVDQHWAPWLAKFWEEIRPRSYGPVGVAKPATLRRKEPASALGRQEDRTNGHKNGHKDQGGAPVPNGARIQQSRAPEARNGAKAGEEAKV